jgi:hypothetical protein
VGLEVALVHLRQSLLVVRPNGLHSDLHRVGWSIGDIFERAIVDLKPELIEKDFDELDVESWEGEKVRIDAVFNEFVVELLRLDIFQDAVEHRKVPEEEYCFCSLGGHFEQTNQAILAFMLKENGIRLFDLLVLHLGKEGVR